LLLARERRRCFYFGVRLTFHHGRVVT
jgi:hypothetical protein